MKLFCPTSIHVAHVYENVHERAVNKLSFHPREANILLSGSQDSTMCCFVSSNFDDVWLLVYSVRTCTCTCSSLIHFVYVHVHVNGGICLCVCVFIFMRCVGMFYCM